MGLGATRLLPPLDLDPSLARPGSGTRGSAGGCAWDSVPSHASSLSAEPGGPQVLPGEQEAWCQRHRPRAVPPSHRPAALGCVWWESIGAAGGPVSLRGAVGRCEAAGAKAADLERQWERAGRREAAAAGGKGGEPGALAVPPLTHSPVETEICSCACRCHLQTTPAPWHSTAQQPLGVVGGTPQTPLPQQRPTAQHGGEGQSCPWAVLMAGLCSPPHRGFLSITLRVRSQAGREPGALACSSPPLLAAQGPPLSGSPQDGGSRAPRGSACIQTLPVFMGATGPGQHGDKSSPGPANKTGIQGRERAAAPGQTWAARAAGGTRRFPAGTGTHNVGLVVSQMRRTRCSHAATRGCLCPGTPTGAVAQHGRGHLDVPRAAAPKLPALRSTSASRHVLLPAHPAARRNQGQPSALAHQRAAKEPSQRREVTGATPGALEELGFVPIAANTSQGWWSPGFPTHTSHGSHLPLPSPQLPAAQAAESGPGAGPASSQRHHPHWTGACCARESGRETSGPAGCFPGRAAKAPFAVASALGRAAQSAGGCSSFLIPALEIIYLLKNSFPWEACSNAEGNLQLQGKNKQFEPWRL